MSVGVVVNPVAGGGRMRRDWPRMEKALSAQLGPLDVKETDGPGEACHLAWRLAVRGADLVIAAGGDGTIGEVVDGLLQAREATGQRCDLAVLPAGSGSDFARGLGLIADVEKLATRIAGGERRAIDAGRVCYITDDGLLHSRHFVNIASLGVSGPTARAVNSARSGDRRAGKLVFLSHSLRELIRYKFQDVRITVDDGEPIEARVALLAVANAPYFGGGMRIAPDAAPDDAVFEVVIVHARSKLSLLRDLRLIYSGGHKALSSCTFLRGTKITVEPQDNLPANCALLDIDGESPGRIPASFEMIPGAITLRG
jgi:diacylglycerol kinase (ATP)